MSRFTLDDLPPGLRAQAEAQLAKIPDGTTRTVTLPNGVSFQARRIPPASAATLAESTPAAAQADPRKIPPGGPVTVDDRPETEIQQALVRWWKDEAVRRQIPEFLLMAFPLSGKRTAKNGARMKAEGMRAGTPDLLLAIPSGDWHGLWIEMKRPKGRLTPAQRTILAALSGRGFHAYACYSLADAQKLIGRYLDAPEELF